MALYSASIKYRFGSGKAITSTSVATNQLKGKSESAVIEFLREKHRSIKNLEILIEKIDWK
jgi:NifU-like protein involved in Fe-S cluster formation